MNKALIVVGLAYGDESKGATVDFLTKEYKSDLTVRFSGGPQCGHNVIDENGNHHTFSQFGSGTLSGAKTLLTKNVLINPLSFMAEALKLNVLVENTNNKVFIDENAVVITPFHIKVNRLREIARGEAKHGSCGHGVWETLSDSLDNVATCLRVADLKHQATTEYKLRRILIRFADIAKELFPSKPWEDELFDIFRIPIENIINHYNKFLKTVETLTTKQANSLINKSKNPIFEGNQGIGLDPNFGFFPYVTANDTTSKGAIQILNECEWKGEREVFGVTRSYTTRHGAGPLVSESSELQSILQDENNPNNPWQNNIRFGWLDACLLNYTISCDGNINSLVVSNLDDLEKLDKWKVCYKYKDMQKQSFRLGSFTNSNLIRAEERTKKFLNSWPVCCELDKANIAKEIEQLLELPVSIVSNGPKTKNRKWIKNDYLSKI